MGRIVTQTSIKAPIARVFDLSRDIDLHQSAMKGSNEKAVAGTTSGLIGLNESVTWEATHFFVRQRLTSRITEMKTPEYFIDEMTQGAFRSMWHKHSFHQDGEYTIMTDDFRYEMPYGIFGKMFDALVLHKYMTHLLKERNKEIIHVAEKQP